MIEYTDLGDGNYSVVTSNGVKEWYDVLARLHRIDGPAQVHTDGTNEWWHRGQRHRVDGPAVIYADGSVEWWQWHQLHRIDGPAVEERSGECHWVQNGQLHRIDGPASIFSDGVVQWWIRDTHISNEVNEWMQENNISWPFDESAQLLFQLRFI